MQCKNLGNIRGQVSIAAQAALNANNISDNTNNNNGVKIFLIIIILIIIIIIIIIKK